MRTCCWDFLRRHCAQSVDYLLNFLVLIFRNIWIWPKEPILAEVTVDNHLILSNNILKRYLKLLVSTILLLLLHRKRMSTPVFPSRLL